MLFLSLFCFMWFSAGAFAIGLVAGISNWRTLKRSGEDTTGMRLMTALCATAIVLVLIATVIVVHLTGNPLQPH